LCCSLQWITFVRRGYAALCWSVYERACHCAGVCLRGSACKPEGSALLDSEWELSGLFGVLRRTVQLMGKDGLKDPLHSKLNCAI
jgi:hypothetical protein